MSFFKLLKYFFKKKDINSFFICKRSPLSFLFYTVSYVVIFALPCFYGCLERDVNEKVSEPVVVDEKVETEKLDVDFYYSDAVEMSKKFVVQSFDTAFHTVKFSPFFADVVNLGDNQFTVKSYVDLQKDCGGVVRKHFICTLKFEKGEWKLKELEFYWPRLEME